MDNTTKLSYIARTYIPSDKAHAVQIAKMCSAFTTNGINAKLYCLSNTQTDLFQYYGIENSFELYSGFTPVKTPVASVQFLKNVAKDIKYNFKPDIIFSRNVYDLLYVSGQGKPIILESHIPPPSAASLLMHKFLFRKKNFMRLVVISEALKKEFLRLFKDLLTNKVVVAHDGADLPKESPAGNTMLQWKGRVNTLQIGYIGSLYRGKGIEFILQLAQVLSNYDFHVIGGKPEDIEKCKAVYNKTNIFFHGYIPHGNLSPYYNHLDVMLAPYSEGVVGSSGKYDLTSWMSPLKIFEYMAASKAIVCSDLPVLREVLTDKQTAILVKPDDVASWKTALELLASDAAARAQLATAARSELEKHYTWQQRAYKVLPDSMKANFM